MRIENNPKIEIRNTGGQRGLFAKKKIFSGELITVFNGKVFWSQKESNLPDEVKDQAIPFGFNYYRDSKTKSFGRFINHSCQPNCYIKNYFEVYAIEDIPSGSEITIMYSLVSNSDWENPEGVCLCRTSKCKGEILPYRKLSAQEKIKWLPYTADWIIYEEVKKAGLIENLALVWQNKG